MITIFNRKELITVISMQQMFRIREGLAVNGIESWAKTAGAWGAARGRGRGVPGINADTATPYTLYVHKKDYDRASVVLQEVLRSL